MNYYLVIGTSYEQTQFGGTDVELFGIFRTNKDAENYVIAHQEKIKSKLSDGWSNYYLQIHKYVNGKELNLHIDFGG